MSDDPTSPAPGDSSSEESGGENVFEVEAILGMTVRREVTRFLVKWLGYPDSENSWELETDLTGCKKLIAAWRAEHDTPEAARRPPPKPAKPPPPPKPAKIGPPRFDLLPGEDEDAAIRRIATSPAFLARWGPKPPRPPTPKYFDCDPPGRWEDGCRCYMEGPAPFSERTVCEAPDEEENKLVVIDRRLVNDALYYTVSYGAALTHWMPHEELRSLDPGALLDWYESIITEQIYMSRDKVKDHSD
jgi:hypothetical protein